MVRIRKRLDDDLDACISVLQRVYLVDRYPVGGISAARSFLTGHALQQSWVAASDDRVVGHISVGTATEDDVACELWWQSHPGDRIATLARLFVDPDSRGSGIAEKLITTAIDWSRAQGLRLVLFALAKDVASGKLYRKLGWTNFGDSTFHFGDGQQMKAYCFVSPEARDTPQFA